MVKVKLKICKLIVNSIFLTPKMFKGIKPPYRQDLTCSPEFFRFMFSFLQTLLVFRFSLGFFGI